LVQDYVVGVLFAGHLLGFSAIADIFTPLTRFGPPIRWIAGATFTLYLMHLPTAQFLAALIPWPRQFWGTRVAIIVGTLVVVFVVAQVTERQKTRWRRGFAALLHATASLRLVGIAKGAHVIRRQLSKRLASVASLITPRAPT
jgi:peptidoglycan/LPS O-acetylase OafA/YrhL